MPEEMTFCSSDKDRFSGGGSGMGRKIPKFHHGFQLSLPVGMHTQKQDHPYFAMLSPFFYIASSLRHHPSHQFGSFP
jgi:hypothetical protein